jgi:prepilin-type N-terminal cleavage/methylation domain-containing protein
MTIHNHSSRFVCALYEKKVCKGKRMKCVTDKTYQPKGLSLIEMVISIALIAIVFAAILPQFRNISNSWASKQGNSEVLQNGRVLVDYLNRNLAKAVRVTAVSNSSETDGYIEFEDKDGITYRCDIAANNYVEFGAVGDLSALAGPVSSLRFTCYALDDLDTAITDVDSIRFVRVEATVVNSSANSRDQTFIASTFIRTNGSGGGQAAVYTEPDSPFEFNITLAASPYVMKINTTHYLCVYTGPGTDGWAVVAEVDTSAWTLTRKTTHEFDNKKGATPVLAQIDSTHYLCAYSGKDDDGWAVVLTVNPSTWAITSGTKFEFDNQQGKTPALAKIDSTHYLLAYSDKQSDGKVVVLTVNTSTWTITKESPLEFDTEKATTPALVQIDSTHYLLAYSDKKSDGKAMVLTVNNSTWAISASGSLEFDTTQATDADLVQIDATHYFCAYSGSNSDGMAVVLIVNDSTWAVTKAATLEFDTDEGQYPSIANIDGQRFICSYQGKNNDGWANVLTVNTGTWAITADIAYEYETNTGKTPVLADIDGTRFLTIYQGGNNDGWACILNTDSELRP